MRTCRVASAAHALKTFGQSSLSAASLLHQKHLTLTLTFHVSVAPRSCRMASGEMTDLTGCVGSKLLPIELWHHPRETPWNYLPPLYISGAVDMKPEQLSGRVDRARCLAHDDGLACQLLQLYSYKT